MRGEVEKQLQFEPSVPIEDKDKALDLAVWRLLGAFEKVITVICVGAKVSYSMWKRKVEVRGLGTVVQAPTLRRCRHRCLVWEPCLTPRLANAVLLMK